MRSDWFNGIEILQGRWQYGEKWNAVIPADLKRLFVSGTYMSRWSRKGQNVTLSKYPFYPFSALFLATGLALQKQQFS
jgi:hypothetical protein